MLITKSPLRVSFVGGGTDIEYFYKNYNGEVISTTINKYVYICCNDRFENNFRLNYSKTELCDNFSKIKHPIIREVLTFHKIDKYLELSSLADVPGSGTGLGSSSAFTSSLLEIINHSMKKHSINKYQLAQLTSYIEIVKCKSPIGKQDQFSTVYGGLNSIKFLKNGEVKVNKIKISKKNKSILEENLILMHSGSIRQTSNILTKQKSYLHSNQSKNLKKKFVDHVFDQIISLKNLLSKETLDMKIFAEIISNNWNLKKEISPYSSNQKINNLYDEAIKCGVKGGKLLGAGGGGFFLFIASQKTQKKLKSNFPNHKFLDFKISEKGTETYEV